MLDETLVNRIVDEVFREMGRPAGPGFGATSGKKTVSDSEGARPKCKSADPGRAVPPPLAAPHPHTPPPKTSDSGCGPDLASQEAKSEILLSSPKDYNALVRMKAHTTARIGVGRCGPRLNTRTLLTLRADHAAARDSVFTDVDQAVLDRLGLFTIQTKCRDKNEFLTRPDLGRQFDDETVRMLASKCRQNPDVQIYAADGLSSAAVNANLPNILPVITDGLTAKGLSVGTPFFVRFCRVPAMDEISEVLKATVTCVLLGERPGLATAESMSAYIAYKAMVGMPEARRTVVSNIHRAGIPAVEAGAYICDIIEAILSAKCSGVDLRRPGSER